nr:immunoglobulin heavy chain junction region [Macaca mulatta]MOW77130.1 immunoglobulin heavy chain junction region [Macaca mulatta]
CASPINNFWSGLGSFDYW